MPKTKQEILDKITEVKNKSMFGFAVNDLLPHLPFEDAQPFLKEGVTEQEWDDLRADKQDPAERIRDYMPFAIGKAQDHRGLSAGRSIEHMEAWLWLDGRDDLVEFLNKPGNYENYGVPILKKICEEYGIETPAAPWFVNMAAGKPCIPGCSDGCGR